MLTDKLKKIVFVTIYHMYGERSLRLPAPLTISCDVLRHFPLRWYLTSRDNKILTNDLPDGVPLILLIVT